MKHQPPAIGTVFLGKTSADDDVGGNDGAEDTHSSTINIEGGSHS